MNEWTGGLPPAAHARIAAQRASRTSGSLLSVAAAASLQSVGLTAVGEVFGCAVMNLGWRGSGCAWWTSGATMRRSSIGQVSPVTTSGGGSTWGSFAPYVGAYERGWYGALKRMRVEAQALGAHGVVDIRIHRTRVEGTAWEFSALGTAVRRAESSHLPVPEAGADPWYTNLSGEDCAAALLAGYLPHSVVLGMSVSTKHEDWQLQQQRTSWINGEVTGMTRLVQAARREARERLARRFTHTGAADLVVTGTTLSEFDTPCGGSDARDLHAEFVVVGTTLVALPRAHRRPAAPPPLTVMPLRDSQHRPRTPEH